MLMDVVRMVLHTLYYKELTEQLTLVRGGAHLHTIAYMVYFEKNVAALDPHKS